MGRITSQSAVQDQVKCKRGRWTHLSRGREEVNHLLDSPGSVHVERDGDKVRSDRLADGVPLLVRRVLEQLLAEVVSERVRHEVREVAVRLAEDHVPVLGHALLELLLQVPAAVLVLAEGQNLALEVLDSSTGKSVDYSDINERQSAALTQQATSLREKTHTRCLGRARLACA